MTEIAHCSMSWDEQLEAEAQAPVDEDSRFEVFFFASLLLDHDERQPITVQDRATLRLTSRSACEAVERTSEVSTSATHHATTRT